MAESIFGRGGALFVVEADEYDRSFLHLRPSKWPWSRTWRPTTSTSTGIPRRRPKRGSGIYLEGVRQGGTWSSARTIPGAGGSVQGSRTKGVTLVTYGLRSLHLRGEEPQISATWVAHLRGRRVDGSTGATLQVRLPGSAQRRNALAAAAVLPGPGGGVACDPPGLEGFGGVRRRFQIAGEAGVSGSWTTMPTTRPRSTASLVRRP
jgi:UDP-N-acetylmuramate--alanine ligase